MIPVPPGPELPPERGWSQTISSEPTPAQQGEILGRIPDQVRVAALSQAVQYLAAKYKPGMVHPDEYTAQLLAAADMFVAWLQGQETFDAWVAGDEEDPRDE